MTRVTTTDQKVGLIFLDEHSKATISTQMAANMKSSRAAAKPRRAGDAQGPRVLGNPVFARSHGPHGPAMAPEDAP